MVKKKYNKQINKSKENIKSTRKKLVKSRVSRNKKLYDGDLTITKQQQFEFRDWNLENTLDLDTSFVDKKTVLKKKTEEQKNNQKKIDIGKKTTNLLLIILIILLGLTAFHYITFNHNKIKVETIEKKVVDENIVFVGDSLTYMYDLNKYFSNYNVVNNGIDGEFSYGVLDDIKDRIYKYNPSKVFLLIGTNDIYKEKSLEEITGNVEKIVKGIKKNRPYCKIYLESLYPINRTDDPKIRIDMIKNRTNEFIREINKEYKKIAKENKITYIDMYAKLIDEDGNLKIDYTKEGLHLNEKGYDFISKELKQYLKN